LGEFEKQHLFGSSRIFFHGRGSHGRNRIEQTDRLITFVNQGKDIFPFIEMFINGQYAGAYSITSTLTIPMRMDEEITRVSLLGYRAGEKGTIQFQKAFVLGNFEEKREKPKQDFL
jgi:hypothetical protein